MRPLRIEFGGLSRSDGSSTFGFGRLFASKTAPADTDLPCCIGSEEVIGSFYGPLEADRRDEQIDRATLRINHRPLDSLPGRKRFRFSLPHMSLTSSSFRTGTLSKAVAASLEPVFLPFISSHAHPKTVLQLTLQSTSSSSTLNYTSMAGRAACVNAASLAMLDAGSINMTAVPVAIAIAAVPTVPRTARWNTSASYVPFEDGMDE